MLIGIVDDGQASTLALRELLKKGVPHNHVTTVYADLQPMASSGQMARAAKSAIDLVLRRGARRVLVLIDREDRGVCCGCRARELEHAIHGLGYREVFVVVKNRKLENWLIADVKAIERISTRFVLTNSFRRAVVPNKADDVVDAAKLLNSVVVDKRRLYHKRHDAIAICKVQSVLRVASNSRSFRRLLRLAGHPEYSGQSLEACE